MAAFVAVAAASGYSVATSVAATLDGTPATQVAAPQPAGSGAYPLCTTLVRTVSSQGYALDTYVSSTSARQGDVVCVNVILVNIDGRNLTVASAGGMSISYAIIGAGGAVVYQYGCTAAGLAAGASAESNFPILSWSCSSFWDTGTPYNGVVPGPGTYHVEVSSSVPNVVGKGLLVAESSTEISLSA